MVRKINHQNKNKEKKLLEKEETFITSFACAWTRFFVDTKRGYCKEFWQQYAIFALLFGGISYFLIYRRTVK